MTVALAFGALVLLVTGLVFLVLWIIDNGAPPAS